MGAARPFSSSKTLSSPAFLTSCRRPAGRQVNSVTCSAAASATKARLANTFPGSVLGFTVDQVVHDYGDVCQCVTALAVERQVPISTDEFRTLNRCIDNAIADAVASFAAEHLRLTDIARQALTAIRTGNIGIGGATGTLLAHALDELRSLTERTLPDPLRAVRCQHGDSALVEDFVGGEAPDDGGESHAAVGDGHVDVGDARQRTHDGELVLRDGPES
jgi:hypothetical protein